MSETEDADLSDVEVDDDFDDYDPVADDPEDEGDVSGEEDVDDAEDESNGVIGEVEDDEATRQKKGRRPLGRQPDKQASQSVDVRPVIIVPDEDRITSNVMTKAEITRAIAIRAEHMTRYPSAFTDVRGLTQAKDIAQKELYDHRSPLVLRRTVGRTATGARIVEKWKVREMSYPSLN